MKALLHYRASPGFARRLAEAGAAAGIETAVVDEADAAGFAREAPSRTAGVSAPARRC